MNHDQAEREALIALWRDVPGTKPTKLQSDGTMFYNEGWRDILPDDHVFALARDAIVEHLNSLGYEVRCWPLHEGAFRIYLDRCDRRPNPHLEVEFSGPTRLLALCAAARAVAGGEQ